MRDPNPRVRAREKFELSLDGRQIASVVVGALVILAVVFVLGLNVGKQIALRQAESRRAGDLEALDRPPTPPAPVKDESLTFHDRLTKQNVPAAPQPEPTPPRPPPAPPQPPAPPAPAVPPADTAASPQAPAAEEPAAEPGKAAAPEKPWTVQLSASADRSEAERLARRFSALNPRIEEADVPGKGRFFRVRVGAFDSRESAERYLRDVARETGAKGFVTTTR
jgi:cell division protein FtsN